MFPLFLHVNSQKSSSSSQKSLKSQIERISTSTSAFFSTSNIFSTLTIFSTFDIFSTSLIFSTSAIFSTSPIFSTSDICSTSTTLSTSAIISTSNFFSEKYRVLVSYVYWIQRKNTQNTENPMGTARFLIKWLPPLTAIHGCLWPKKLPAPTRPSGPYVGTVEWICIFTM